MFQLPLSNTLDQIGLKPCPNGLASRRMSTQVFDLRSTFILFGDRVALTCIDFSWSSLNSYASRRKFLQKLSPFGQGLKKRKNQTFQSRNSVRISRHHTSVVKSIRNGSSVICRCWNLCPAARQLEHLGMKIRIRPWAYNYKSIAFLNTQILKYR